MPPIDERTATVRKPKRKVPCMKHYHQHYSHHRHNLTIDVALPASSPGANDPMRKIDIFTRFKCLFHELIVM